MKKKTFLVISVIFVLIFAFTFFAFARGKGPNLTKIQLDANTFKKIEPAINNLYSSIKNLINKEVSAGIMTNYFSDNLIKNLDAAYAQIEKTRTIYLPIYGGRGLFNAGFGLYGQKQNQPQQNQPAGNPPYGPKGFGYNQLNQQQLQSIKNLTPEILKVIDAELAFGKALKDAGVITDLQFTVYSSRIEQIKQSFEQYPLLHYGLMQFFMIAGYNPNN